MNFQLDAFTGSAQSDLFGAPILPGSRDGEKHDLARRGVNCSSAWQRRCQHPFDSNNGPASGSASLLLDLRLRDVLSAERSTAEPLLSRPHAKAKLVAGKVTAATVSHSQPPGRLAVWNGIIVIFAGAAWSSKLDILAGGVRTHQACTRPRAVNRATMSSLPCAAATETALLPAASARHGSAPRATS